MSRRQAQAQSAGDRTGETIRVRGKRYLVVGRQSGGEGGVVRARDPHARRMVAIHVRDGKADDYLTVLRRVTTNNHAFPMLLDHEFRDGKTYVVTPWVEGTSLGDVLRAKDDRFRPSAADSFRMVRHLARGLCRLHEKRLIHGDIKPDNLVVQRKPLRLTLIDFGISWTGEVAKRRSSKASARYASPEQLFDRQLVDERTDQFALAAVLYEMVTQAVPYEIGGMAAADPHPPALVPSRKLNRESWKGLDEVLERALALDPDRRFGTTREFERALAAVAPLTEGDEPSSLLSALARAVTRWFGRLAERS